MEEKNLIELKDCHVADQKGILLENISWSMKKGEAWLVTGPNGGGKADFISALAGRNHFEKKSGTSVLKNSFDDVVIVSLEEAAKLIEEERLLDETDYMDRIDTGRTGRRFLAEVLGGSRNRKDPLPEIACRLETFPQVKLCGVEHILDRGLKFMSTGEIRRTLLCRALLSGAKLLVLSDPFAGLDKDSRKILLEFFDTVTSRQLSSDGENPFPSIILSMERFVEIPESINKVLEFEDRKIAYCGDRKTFEEKLAEKNRVRSEKRQALKKEFLEQLAKIRSDTSFILSAEESAADESLIKFEDVNVGWDDHKVLVNLNWEVKKGCHWLIRGPNGSGKTTILELITGDNMQVFREKVYIFGARRGSGESIWDIKKKLGIVSYRLHVEYRMVGGTSLENVIISGFHDSIGFYQIPTDVEKSLARAWLALGGFAGRENENFSNLSYGEQRTVLILRSAVKSPKVLVLDEPCHGLDAANREKVLDLVETIAETGTTTILHVTHDPTEVCECETNVLELHPGESPMYRILNER